MKLFNGWEEKLKPAPNFGADVYYGSKPDGKQRYYYMYKSVCKGCGAPHLAQAKRVGDHYEYPDYCEQSCWFKYREITDEQRQRWSDAGKNRSPEVVQHVLEANRRPRSAETREKQAAVWRGRKHTEETKEKMSTAATGVKKDPAAVEKSARSRLNPDRLFVVHNKVKHRYTSNASAHSRTFLLEDDTFISLLHENCFYCGAEPYDDVCIRARGTVYLREDEAIKLGGIDRLDSALGYTVENCVPACTACNIAKGKRSVPEFVAWVLRVANFMENRPPVLACLGEISEAQKINLNYLYTRYYRHKTTDEAGAKQYIQNTIGKDDFAKLIQTQCNYCGAGLSNTVVRDRGRERNIPAPERTLHYNGLDRLDSNGIYELTNVVPCCVVCNRAKNVMPMDEFYAWTQRVAAHIRSTPELMALAA
jgi:5-methylcytosine-specific restriction endonuclease McrA